MFDPTNSAKNCLLFYLNKDFVSGSSFKGYFTIPHATYRPAIVKSDGTIANTDEAWNKSSPASTSYLGITPYNISDYSYVKLDASNKVTTTENDIKTYVFAFTSPGSSKNVVFSNKHIKFNYVSYNGNRYEINENNTQKIFFTTKSKMLLNPSYSMKMQAITFCHMQQRTPLL